MAGPLIRHLLDHSTHTVTVAALDDVRARALVGTHPRGRVVPLDVSDAVATERLIVDSDAVVSLLPYAHHPAVAERCVAHKKHLVTTSYVSPAMRELDGAARRVGVVLLNEMGLDPGLDHMSAMRIIHDVRRRGGRVTAFRSYCGGLPAPEANDNPLLYKFSWSPRGVVLAARNGGKYLEDGIVIDIQPGRIFDTPETVTFEGLGAFEGYPNRTSLDYIPLYGLDGVRTMFRGTLRNVGHCATWRLMGTLGFYADALVTPAQPTYRSLMALLLDAKPDADLVALAGARGGLAQDAREIHALDWLGLFDGTALPAATVSPLDALVSRMVERMSFAQGERDMVVMRHDFIADFTNHRESIRSTLVDYGVPHGDTAMARTVALPAAIGVLRILDGTIRTPGVQVPVSTDVYQPVLDTLTELGVSFVEQRSTV